MPHAPIVLASRSPRRSQLLAQIGVPHEVLALDLERLARDKALHARTARRDGRLLLAADTIVVLDGTIFGKPRDEPGAVGMLRALSGRCHEVMTAVAVCDGSDVRTAVSVSRVTFRELGEAECRAYWDTGEPADKAGAYAVQGLGAVFIERLEGSYSGVMGLPLFETARLLQAAGVPVWQGEEPG
jgi:septum formation protein